MTPHDIGIEALVSDPSLLDIPNVQNVEHEIPLVDPRFSHLTDIDVLYRFRQHGHTRIAIVELKTGKHKEWGCAVRQLSIGTAYVRQRYGIDPMCYYVYGVPDRFTVLRSERGIDTFEPIWTHERARTLSRTIRNQLPYLKPSLPENIVFYGN